MGGLSVSRRDREEGPQRILTIVTRDGWVEV